MIFPIGLCGIYIALLMFLCGVNMGDLNFSVLWEGDTFKARRRQPGIQFP